MIKGSIAGESGEGYRERRGNRSWGTGEQTNRETGEQGSRRTGEQEWVLGEWKKEGVPSPSSSHFSPPPPTHFLHVSGCLNNTPASPRSHLQRRLNTHPAL